MFCIFIYLFSAPKKERRSIERECAAFGRLDRIIGGTAASRISPPRFIFFFLIKGLGTDVQGHFDDALGAPLGPKPRLQEAPRCRLLASAWLAQIPSPPSSFCRCNHTPWRLESQLVMSTHSGSARRKFGGFRDVATAVPVDMRPPTCLFVSSKPGFVRWSLLLMQPQSSVQCPGGSSYHTTRSFLCVCTHIASSASEEALVASCKICVPSLQQRP